MITRSAARKAWSTVAFAALVVGGCAGGADGSDGSPTDVEGTWGSSAKASPNLTFASDGTVTGTDGCNRLTGSWSVDGDVVRLARLASTMMYCEGVDTWLSGAAQVVVSGTTLEVRDDTGTKIGTLERAAS